VVVSASRVVSVVCDAGDDMRPWLRAVREAGLRMLVVSRAAPDARRDELERLAGATQRFDAREAPRRFEADAGSDLGGDIETDITGCVLLATSGSTGTPRLVELAWPALEASGRLGARRIPFGAGDAWHGSLSPAHIGGLMIHARALVLGGEVRVAPPPRAWSDLAGCTHCSLVAPQLARLLDDPADPPATLRAAMLGGGPSARALHDAAIARGVPLYSTYGMTETASQVATGLRARGDAATLAGAPLEGIRISIDAPSGEIGEIGEILVDGPTLARAVHGDGARHAVARPFRTRDTGFLDESGRLHVVGRLDAMFISGGRNIHPESIERALLAIPGVRTACVVGVPHAKWGMRPVAFVDIAGDRATHSEASLRAALAHELDAPLVPDAFLSMPADEAARMKPSRAALAARLASHERFPAL
jgi:O-succinylbenzoic acid--CoA ligase